MGNNEFTEEEKQSIKKIEQLLYRYPTTQQRINKLEIDIEIIEHDYETIHGQSNNQIKASTMTNETHDLSDNIVMKENRIKAIKDEIFKEKITAKMIENAVSTLDETDNKVIKKRYFEKVTVQAIASEMGYYRESIFFKCRTIIRDKLMQYMTSIK